MTPEDIARLRLHNQQIAHATLRTSGEVVAHLGAVQAQDFDGAKWAVGLRLAGATVADIERAIADREIVRTWPMRHTLHFVAAADVVKWRRLMTHPTFFPTPAELRAWYEANHQAAPELLLGFHKVGSGRPSVTYGEALDAALCFGWIDGVRRRIDEYSYSIRFTPRKRKANWSLANIQRAQQLIMQGLMHPAGLRAFEGRDEAAALTQYHERRNSVFDDTRLRRFRARKDAWMFFEAQPASYRLTATWWVMSARRQDTRSSRFEILLEYSERRERVPLMTAPERRR